MLKDGKEYVLDSVEEAVKLHLEMWSDMQKELGDTPDSGARFDYKKQWLIKHGYDDVENNCFLCEFAYRRGYRQALEDEILIRKRMKGRVEENHEKEENNAI